MQRPSGGYRGGIRLAHQNPSNRHLSDEKNDEDDNDRLKLSNSDSDDHEDYDNDEQEMNHSLEVKKPSSLYSKINANGDLESAIRSLRPSAIHSTKTKTVHSVSHQKADLPQLNLNNENNPLTSSSDGQKSDEKSQVDTQSRPWFPKADVGHVDSDAFIRHNHIESQKSVDSIETTAPPAILTTIPPVGVSARPTAKVASTGQTRSTSALFTSKVSTQKTNDIDHNNGILPINGSRSSGEDSQPKTMLLVHTASSAFQPIQNLLQRQASAKNSPVFLDIRQHKPLERGQKLQNIHVSHPQSPTTIHLMLNEDFITACRLLNDMATHLELQLDRIPVNPFKPQPNRLCACFHEGRWFRCRILQVSPDNSAATVVYLDWGMTISMQIGPNSMRRLPNEFYNEPACSLMCRLHGVPEPHDFIPPGTIAQCLKLLSESQYELIVNETDRNNNIHITLFFNGKCINQQIKELLQLNTMTTTMTLEEELIEQFRYELPLNVGDEFKALLSSFSGKDDAFYVLLVNQDTLTIDKAMSEFQETSFLNRSSVEPPRIKTIVAARYADDGKFYRAWVKSIAYDREEVLVFFVDFGNESSVSFTDIYPCPDSVKSLPWLGIRIRLVDENMSYDELVHFWKVAESNYIWIKILDIFTDSYGVQIKLDYTVFLRQERMKSVTHRLIHVGVQTNSDDGFFSRKHLSTSSDVNSSLTTPTFHDQTSTGNETLVRNLFEMITKELRHLRHRINDSDEASQDRHNQLMQLLISSFNLNNSNNSKRL